MSWFAAVVVASLGAVVAAQAGTVEVFVHEELGPPVDNVQVAVRQDDGTTPARGRAVAYAKTGVDGRALLTDIPPGAYVIDLRGSSHPYVGHPALPGFGPPPRITLLEGADTVEVDLPLRRGFALVVRTSIDGPGQAPSGLVRMRDLDRALTVEQEIHDLNWTETLLPVGRWEVEVVAEGGYILVGLDRDGTRLDGHTALLDVDRDSQTIGVTFVYRAPAQLEGQVVVNTDREWTIPIEAVLVEVGPWFEEARARGGSVFDRVLADADSRKGGYYSMTLPDGSWRIRPVPETVASSEPVAVDLDLLPGQVGRADFTVEMRSGSGEAATVLYVLVTDPERRRVKDAIVELWAMEDGSVVGEAIASGRTRRYSNIVTFRGMPEGEYRIVAGHLRHGDGQATVTVREEENRPVRVSVQLEQASRLQFVRREGSLPSSAVVIDATWLGDEPPTLIRDPTFVAEKSALTVRTGVDGSGLLDGVSAGEWRITAHDTTGLHGRAVRVARVGEEALDAVELEIGDRDTVTVEVAVVKAGSIRAVLACFDEGPLPTVAVVRVLGADGEIVAQVERPLGDRYFPEVVVGGLEAGFYTLSVRPRGFDEWTWSPGTEDQLAAARIDVEEGEIAEVGQLSIECQPRLNFFATVASKQELPDLRDAEVTATIRVSESADEAVEVKSDISQFADSLLIGNFFPGAEAEIELELEVAHQHFLPERSVISVHELAVERGQVYRLEMVVPAVGGSLEVAETTARFALLTSDDLHREAVAKDGRVRFENVPPGVHRLALCGTHACEQPSRVWEQVEVTAGKELRLSAD